MAKPGRALAGPIRDKILKDYREKNLAAATLSSTADAVDALAGANADESEIDFGSDPAYSATATIANANITTGSVIVIAASGNAPTGGHSDDEEWDRTTYSAKPGSGDMLVTATVHPGPVSGKRKFFYQVL